MYKFASECGTGNIFINAAKQHLKSSNLLEKEAERWGIPADDVKAALELVVLEQK